MGSMDELILKTTKEIVVKFIELGRLSPSNFHSTFKEMYQTVAETVKGADEASGTMNEDEIT
ncbi:MAG: conjugal transfer protein TraB [Deltaproteobacteria bacterium]|nr:conjugal transfer protein TraB [Deltaproteobacteria bacterium]